MSRPRLALAALFLISGTTSSAADVAGIQAEGFFDLRGIAVDSSLQSFVHGGLGLLQFDDDHDGVQSGRFVVDVNSPLTETLRMQLTTIATAGEDEQNPVDVTEAYIEWRPYPQSHWRWRTKVGAFYPPVSLE